MTMLSSSNSSSSWSTTIWTAAGSCATVGWLAHHIYQTRRDRRQRLGNFPASTPFLLPVSLDLVYLIRAGSLDRFVQQRRASLKSDCFYLRLPGMARHCLVLTDARDQTEFMRRYEHKLSLVVDLPDTMKSTHGPGSLQLASGARHNFYRKIFSGLLSPVALASFVPSLHRAFRTMWNELEVQSSNRLNDNSVVILQDAICQTQFFLMAQILYGMTPHNNTAMEQQQLQQMRHDFEAQLQGHFAPPTSATFRNAQEASRRLHRILAERFQAVLQQARQSRTKTESAPEDAKEKQAHDSPRRGDKTEIGNAMETIANALIKEGVDRDPQVIADTIDNLNLLLEASHGTTMTVTTNTLFYLNHPDNIAKLQKLRAEAQTFRFKEDEEGLPDYAQLKGQMPYADAVIKEAMRMAPIITMANYAVKNQDTTFTFKGQTLQGPLSVMMSWGQSFSDPQVFPQPDAFVPERWMEHEPCPIPHVSEAARAAFKPFGLGRHICLGYQLATLVMKSSLYCFARDEDRVIEFDVDKVVKKPGIFPSYSISDGFPGRVVVTTHE